MFMVPPLPKSHSKITGSEVKYVTGTGVSSQAVFVPKLTITVLYLLIIVIILTKVQMFFSGFSDGLTIAGQ